MNVEIFQKVQELVEQHRPFVLVTVVASRGSVPHRAGGKMIVCAAHEFMGTVGGGKIEARALQWALELLEQRASDPQIVKWNLRQDLGMTCGGEVTILFEPVGLTSREVVVFGAGHVAQALVDLLVKLDCRVFCIDARAEWLEKLPKHPYVDYFQMKEPARYVERIAAHQLVVIMTQGHASDLPILAQILQQPQVPKFVGVIGSQSKRAILMRELLGCGLTEEQACQFVCPIGLKTIKSHTPYEIAVSIAAQLLQYSQGINKQGH